MFAKISISALLAGSVMSAVLDLPTITNAMQVIGDDIGKLADAITSWDGSQKGAQIMSDASTALNKAITDQTAAIEAGTPLSLFDSIALLTPTNVLNQKTDALADAMIAAKPKYDALGLSKGVAENIVAQKGASKKLQDAIFSKLPDLAKTVGANAAGQVTGKLDQAAALFSGQISAIPAAPAAEPAADATMAMPMV